jgi:hypothetical protein
MSVAVGLGMVKQKAVLSTLCALMLGSATAAQAGSITLAWDRNPEPFVAGYRIYFGHQSGQ